MILLDEGYIEVDAGIGGHRADSEIRISPSLPLQSSNHSQSKESI